MSLALLRFADEAIEDILKLEGSKGHTDSLNDFCTRFSEFCGGRRRSDHIAKWRVDFRKTPPIILMSSRFGVNRQWYGEEVRRRSAWKGCFYIERNLERHNIPADRASLKRWFALRWCGRNMNGPSDCLWKDEKADMIHVLQCFESCVHVPKSTVEHSKHMLTWR